MLRRSTPRSETIRQDWRSFKNFNDTYAAAAHDILTILDAASTTSATVVNHPDALDSLLLNVIGFSNAGTNLLVTSKDSLVASANVLEPTTNLLLKYSPDLHLLAAGPDGYLDNGGYSASGGARRPHAFSSTSRLLLGNDPYALSRQSADRRRPRADRAGSRAAGRCRTSRRTSRCASSSRTPDGEPAWTSGPTLASGIRARPNWFPVTRAVPEPPSIRQCIPGPAIGPVPYPGAPPYGAPLYGPGGVPLWPGVPPAEPEPGAGATRGRTARRHRDRRRTTDAGGLAVGNLRGAVWRLGIFLAVCLLGAFVLLTVFGAVPVPDRQELLRRVHQRLRPEGRRHRPDRRSGGRQGSRKSPSTETRRCGSSSPPTIRWSSPRDPGR